MEATIILQLSHHNRKLPFPRQKQGNYPVISIYVVGYFVFYHHSFGWRMREIWPVMSRYRPHQELVTKDADIYNREYFKGIWISSVLFVARN